MVKEHLVHGYDAFIKLADSLEGQLVHVLFTGTEDPVTGISWCPFCVKADPVINAAKNKAPANSHLIVVKVGSRPAFKDPTTPFRTDRRINLTYVPTLMRWKSAQRLNGDECLKQDLVEMVFTDDE